MGNILFCLPHPPPNVQQEQKLSSCLALIAQKKKKPRVWTAARGRKNNNRPIIFVFHFCHFISRPCFCSYGCHSNVSWCFFPLLPERTKRGGWGLFFWRRGRGKKYLYSLQYTPFLFLLFYIGEEKKEKPQKHKSTFMLLSKR